MHPTAWRGAQVHPTAWRGAQVRLRGALLGAGNVALRGHAPQWLKPAIRDEAEIVAVADISEANREAARRLFPAAAIYESAESLLDAEALDFCDVCTPPFTRLPLIEEAVDRGLHVLCEKPIALDLEEAERIAMLVSAAGIVFKPCHQYHHSPQWKTVQALVPSIGRIRLAKYEVRRLCANEGNPHWVPEWRTSAALAGGGILIDHGAHVFYQLRAVMGEARHVRATVRTLQHKGYGVEDTACILLESDDAIAEVTLTWAAHRRETCFRLVGEHGEITGDEQEVRVWTAQGTHSVHPGGLSADSSHSDWYGPLLADFVRQVRQRAPAPEEVEEAMYVARVVACAYASSEAKRALPLQGAAGLALAGTTEGASPHMEMAESIEPPATEVGTGRRRVRRAAQRGVVLAGLFGAVAWMLHDVAWRDVWHVLGTAEPLWIAAAAAVNLGVLLCQTARWLALVRPLAPAASLKSALKAMVMGLTVSTFVPARGGELARVELFGRETGIPRMAVIGSVLLDTLVNAVVLLVAAAVLPFFISVPLWLRPGGWLALTLFTLGAIVVIVLRPVGQTQWPGLAGRLPLRRGFAELVTQARQGLAATRDSRALAWSFSASLAAWTLEVNVTDLSLRAVGLHLPLASTLLVLLAVNIVLALPVATPANLGTLEIGATLALVELGVGKERAIAFALCYHLLQIIPIAAIGLALALRGWVGERRARQH